MKPETADALARARAHLTEAERILEIEIPSVAGRQAYLATLTAARGLVFELLGKGPKSHKGIKALAHELIRDGLPIDRSLLSVLDSGFDLKIEADYGDPANIGEAEARKALRMQPRSCSRLKPF